MSENTSSRGIIWPVIALLIIGGGIYLFGDKQPAAQVPEPGNQEIPVVTEEWQDYQSPLGIAFKIPPGYLVDERENGLLVVAEPTEDNPEPRPEFQVQTTEGTLSDMKIGKGIELITDEEVIINGMKGRRFVITSEALPAGTECDFYSFEDRGVVYEFSEYECQASSIFLAVLNTFELRWEK